MFEGADYLLTAFVAILRPGDEGRLAIFPKNELRSVEISPKINLAAWQSECGEMPRSIEYRTKSSTSFRACSGLTRDILLLLGEVRVEVVVTCPRNDVPEGILDAETVDIDQKAAKGRVPVGH